MGERARTCGQLQLFANLLREGWWVDARKDVALPERKPMPKADISRDPKLLMCIIALI